MSNCYKCKHKAEEGYISHICLTYKYAYFESSKAFERKADLYEEKEKHKDVVFCKKIL